MYTFLETDCAFKFFFVISLLGWNWGLLWALFFCFTLLLLFRCHIIFTRRLGHPSLLSLRQFTLGIPFKTETRSYEAREQVRTVSCLDVFPCVFGGTFTFIHENKGAW